MRNLRIFLLVILSLAAVLSSSSAQAQVATEQKFPTGYVVRGEFLKFYYSAPDPQLIFGYPQSKEIKKYDIIVQYFDRARFELKNTPEGPKVSLTPLGEWNKTNVGQPAVFPTNSAACRMFPSHGKSVCYNFLRFYDEYNGPVFFGSPVTEVIELNGWLVQYFDYVRMEYRPNAPGSLKVGLTNLGQSALLVYEGLPSVDVKMNSNAPVRPEEIALQVKAFVSQAIVAPKTPNTVFIVVQTKAFTPIAGAQVAVKLVYPGNPVVIPPATTDTDGIAKINLPGLDLQARQIVQVQVEVKYGGKSLSTSTWYRIWY